MGNRPNRTVLSTLGTWDAGAERHVSAFPITAPGAEHHNALRFGRLIGRLAPGVTHVAPWLGAERRLSWCTVG